MLNRKAFTLIEVMIIIFIICVLAAIVIPKFANLKRRVMTEVKQVPMESVASQIQVLQVLEVQTSPTGWTSSLSVLCDRKHGNLIYITANSRGGSNSMFVLSQPC